MFDCGVHCRQPVITLERANRKRGVPHAEAGVPSFVGIGGRPAPVLHEEKAEPFLCHGQVVLLGIEREQYLILGDANVIEVVDQFGKEWFPTDSFEQGCRSHPITVPMRRPRRLGKKGTTVPPLPE